MCWWGLTQTQIVTELVGKTAMMQNVTAPASDDILVCYEILLSVM